ncbi:MAG: class I SAM-dependent methyltransferase [Sphingobacteriales bacterium]|nr:MAG: class I SAM-dependent methyltransferase [Sphingobacteriales bacterium]
MIKEHKPYYKEVGEYYDQDAPQFEHRYWENKTLQTIRQSFREETEAQQFGDNILEVGFGPGVDIIYFAKKYPQKKVSGIDISDGMHQHAQSQVEANKLTNTRLEVGSVEDIKELFPRQKFDLIYVYFGALNTVSDLHLAAELLKDVLSADGKLVITVINKWYLSGIALPLMKGKVSVAFRRLQKVWGGYSNTRQLESKCYTPAEIKKAFSSFQIIKRRGYSIAYPAWYQNNIVKKLGSLANALWKLDVILNCTPFWSKGEYALYILKHRR